eukprot:3115453-Rhodomonas_salina.2
MGNSSGLSQRHPGGRRAASTMEGWAHSPPIQAGTSTSPRKPTSSHTPATYKLLTSRTTG